MDNILNQSDLIVIGCINDLLKEIYNYNINIYFLTVYKDNKLYDIYILYKNLNNIIKIISKYNNLIIINNLNYNLNINKNNIINILGLYYSKFKKSLNLSTLIELNNKIKSINNKLIIYYLNRNSKSIPPVSILSEFIYYLSNIYIKIYNLNIEYIYSAEYKAYLKRCMNFEILHNNGVNVNTNIIKFMINDPLLQKEHNKKLVNTIYNFHDNINGIIYPEYYFNKTPTGRVMSSYKTTNMMALDKTNIIRYLIISRFYNGRLFNFDYDGMQLRIVSNLIDFNIPLKYRAHQYIASKYFNIAYSKINKDQIKYSKELIWKVMYGSENLSFFTPKLNNFISIYLNNTVTPLNRKIENNISNYQKLNYFINKYEVDYITIVLENVNDYIKKNNLNMLLFMYTYDGFLIDCPEKEFKHIDNIKEISENSIKKYRYPVNIKWGYNFKNMEKYNG